MPYWNRYVGPLMQSALLYVSLFKRKLGSSHCLLYFVPKAHPFQRIDHNGSIGLSWLLHIGSLSEGILVFISTSYVKL